MAKIRVGGLKLSPELVMVTQRFNAAEACSVPPIYRLFGQQKINIHYLSAQEREKQTHIVCLVSMGEHRRVKNLPHLHPDETGRIQIFPGKGMVSLFPHRSRMDILGLVVKTLASAGVGIYGYSASISSLVFVIDYEAQQRAISAISSCFELPEYHSPYRSRLILVEKRD